MSCSRSHVRPVTERLRATVRLPGFFTPSKSIAGTAQIRWSPASWNLSVEVREWCEYAFAMPDVSHDQTVTFLFLLDDQWVPRNQIKGCCSLVAVRPVVVGFSKEA